MVILHVLEARLYFGTAGSRVGIVVTAYCLHTVCILSAYCLHTVCILSAYCLHTVCILFAYCLHCLRRPCYHYRTHCVRTSCYCSGVLVVCFGSSVTALGNPCSFLTKIYSGATTFWLLVLEVHATKTITALVGNLVTLLTV